MTIFPDNDSKAGSRAKAFDPLGNTYRASDKDGYVLYGHDITSDGSTAGTVNYLANQYMAYCYTVRSDGTISQCNTAGKLLNP